MADGADRDRWVAVDARLESALGIHDEVLRATLDESDAAREMDELLTEIASLSTLIRYRALRGGDILPLAIERVRIVRLRQREG